MTTWLIVGLGNPGLRYRSTRHNIGFMVIDELAEKYKPSFQQKFFSQFASVTESETKLLLQKPETYMNVSGKAVLAASQFYQIPTKNIIVIHDELDLPFGALKIKSGGGHAGHNGLRSISEMLGADYIRLRFGIGRPTGSMTTSDYVLQPFSAKEAEQIPAVNFQAAHMIQSIVSHGVAYAMNQHNGKTE